MIAMLTNLEQYGGFRYFVATIESLVEQRKGRVLANPRTIATNGKNFHN
ncbi:MAG: hypothetical protein MZV64_64875 [Ignavibacteriales bacterium]|nr:hypothetical protein [Ignavibacteriales bacterium]